MIIRRLHLPSAGLALLATSFFIGECLWASTCAPMTVGAPAPASTSMVGGTAEDPDCTPARDGETDCDDGSDCPFAGVATSAGCVSAAMGAAPVRLIPDAPRTTDPVASVESYLDLAPVTSLFHPPRA